jgi:hypothetical protein
MPYDELLRARFSPDARGNPRLRVHVRTTVKGTTVTIQLRSHEWVTLSDADWCMLATLPHHTKLTPPQIMVLDRQVNDHTTVHEAWAVRETIPPGEST